VVMDEVMVVVIVAVVVVVVCALAGTLSFGV
jgi:hypothetical protein